MTSFRVLGKLDVIHADVPADPAPRQLLGMFLLYANERVHIDLLTEELGRGVAARAEVDRIRPLLALDGATLVTRASGYLLDIDPDLIDLGVFRRLVRRGREHLDRGRPGEAASVLRRALGIWTGPVLAGVRSGPVLTARMAPLREERRRAFRLRVQADIRLGRRDLIEELRLLAGADPHDEWLSEQLVSALIAAGRCSEALQLHLNLRLLQEREFGAEALAAGD